MGRTRSASVLAASIASIGLVACPAFNNRERDIDRTPIVDTGAGASIIYPGQAPPIYQGAQHPKQTGAGSYGNAPQSAGSPAATPESSGRMTGSGSGAPSGGRITLLGGNTTEEKRHQKIKEEPIWWKYVSLPFAVVAAPFVYAADKLRPEEEAGPEVPRLDNAPAPEPRGPAPVDYETARLQQLERELTERQGAASPRSSSSSGALPSLADELALLRRPVERSEPSPPVSPPAVASAPTEAPAPPRAAEPTRAQPAADPSLVSASGHVDRDGDGRTDHWIFREAGEIKREVLDENFDGRPDRTLHYDLASHEIRAIEEDTDFDGRTDTWTAVRDGAIARRRADANGDSHVDTWSFFREGILTRLERDSSGDGFRDRITYYDRGLLVREEQDTDADGRAETVKHYDEREQVSKLEEDSDRDGRIDVISHYEDGRLTRRELLDASALAPAPKLTEHN